MTWLGQSETVVTAWKDFVLRTSSLTDMDIPKINELIRAYIDILLGIQAQTDEGKWYQAQVLKISSSQSQRALSIRKPTCNSIDQFQYSLQYAKTTLNFVVKPSLYFRAFGHGFEGWRARWLQFANRAFKLTNGVTTNTKRTVASRRLTLNQLSNTTYTKYNANYTTKS